MVGGPGPVPDHDKSWKSYLFEKQYVFLYQLLEVPRGLWRSGNVPKRLWDVLELFYIEFLIKICKTNVSKSFIGYETPSQSFCFRFDYINPTDICWRCLLFWLLAWSLLNSVVRVFFSYTWVLFHTPGVRPRCLFFPQHLLLVGLLNFQPWAHSTAM